MRQWIYGTLRQAAWAPLAVFLFYAVAAKGFNAYILYPWLDMPTHFCGGLAITWFYLAAGTHGQVLAGPVPRPVILLMSLGLTALTAVLWEFLEYLSDVLLHTQMNLGVADTLSDLLFGLLGGSVAVTAAACSTRLLREFAREAPRL